MDELHCQFHTTASTASPARSRDVSVDITNNLMMQPVVGGKSNVIWLYIYIYIYIYNCERNVYHVYDNIRSFLISDDVEHSELQADNTGRTKHQFNGHKKLSLTFSCKTNISDGEHKFIKNYRKLNLLA